MDYKQFDKLKHRKTTENIKELLNNKPYSLDELSKITNLDRTSIHYHVKKLEKKGIVEARGMGKKVYYGLKQEYRQQETREGNGTRKKMFL